MHKLIVPLYVVYAGSLLALKFPFWIFKFYAFPASRSKPSWTLNQQLLVNFLKTFIGITVSTGATFSKSPDLPLINSDELVHSHAVELKPLDKRYLRGIIEKVARDVGGLDVVLRDDGTRKVGPRRIPAYWYTESKLNKTDKLEPLTNTDDDLVMLFFHGGAYLFGTAHERDNTSKISRELMEKTAITRVLSVDYRLSGIAPFPAALIDALTGYHYLIETCKIPPSRIMIAGDSAGGNLALALARYLRDEGSHIGLPSPSSMLLLSPWADMSQSHWQGAERSAVYNKDSDYVGSDLGDKAVAQFLKGHHESLCRNPYVSPGSTYVTEPKTFADFPKTYILAGGAEVLLDEIMYLKGKMQDAIGADKVWCDIVPDAPHDILIWQNWGPTRERSVQKLGRWLEEQYPVAAQSKKARVTKKQK